MKLPEPEAFRFNFDGYGWDYRDNGSGSSWKDMAAHNHGEFLFTESQLKAYGEACYRQAIEDAAMRCMDYMEDTYGSTYGVGECIRRLLIGFNGLTEAETNNSMSVRGLSKPKKLSSYERKCFNDWKNP